MWRADRAGSCPRPGLLGWSRSQPAALGALLVAPACLRLTVLAPLYRPCIVQYISKYLQEGEAGFGTFTEAQLGEPAQA